MAKILVYSEDITTLEELLGKARQATEEQAFEQVEATLFGSALTEEQMAQLGEWGADVVYAVLAPELQGYHPETYTDALAGIIAHAQPDLVLIGATKRGLEISGRAAERLGLGVVSWCIDFRRDPQTKMITAESMIYTGLGKNTYHFDSYPALATVAPGTFRPQQQAGQTAQVINLTLPITPPVLQVLENNEKAEAGRRLQDAPVIVDVGQGIRERGDLAMVHELAEMLTGQVACSRPVSSERDWFPEWLGLSGLKLAPDLCITLGISGSIQHMIGIRDSRVIVAVNNDEGAGIFAQADYGVKADLYEFVPAFMAALKARLVTKA
jgi:electron transfer flavoprotein alpha subunit